jgi:hypothetical protein
MAVTAISLYKLQQKQTNATMCTWAYSAAKRCAARHLTKLKMQGFATKLVSIKSTFG